MSKDKVLLVTAHPDDECMFFTPSIRSFIGQGRKVDLICLSTGNYDGMGERRRRELEKSAQVLGISSVIVIDDAELQDGPDSIWKPECIKKHVLRMLMENRSLYSTILTFDDEGVSGHPNHCSISKALSGIEVDCLRLKSLPVWLKYLGPVGLWICPLVWKDELVYRISICDAYLYGYIAMTRHESQMVWFRRLYLIFSVYMTCNILSRKKT